MINKKLIDLYKYFYGAKYDSVIPCGVVDEETYLKVYPKIIFLLREAHMRTAYNIESKWTIPKGLARNVSIGLAGNTMELKYMRTWKQAGVWAYAIIHGFDKYAKLKQPKYVAEGLKSIGMTNLKKTGGSATSKWHEIRSHALKDKALWHRELEIMNPDLILCGGTYNHVITSLGLERHLLYKDESRSYQYSLLKINGKSSIILSFWHPNNRRNRDTNLGVLKILLERITEEGLLNS